MLLYCPLWCVKGYGHLLSVDMGPSSGFATRGAKECKSPYMSLQQSRTATKSLKSRSRQVAFNKRSTGLMKKANELSILCDAEVAVLGYSSTGKRFEFSSSSMERTLSRYEKCLRRSEKSIFDLDPEVEDETNCGQTNAELNLTHRVTETDILKEQVTKLKLKQSQLMEKDPHGVDVVELRQQLQQQEQQLNEALLSVNEKKEKILMKQLEQARAIEYRVISENEALRKQVEELQGCFLPIERAKPLSLEYDPLLNNSLDKAAVGRPDIVCNNGIEIGDSDTTLQLGPPSGIFCEKRKALEEETHSRDYESQRR